MYLGTSKRDGKTFVVLKEKDKFIDFSMAWFAYQVVVEKKKDPFYARSLDDFFEESFTELVSKVYQFIKEKRLIDFYYLRNEPQFVQPILHPSKIICLARNYGEHAKEANMTIPKEPVFFAKAPSALIGPNEEIIAKKGWGRIDPEAELAVIIGKKCKDCTKDNAYKYIAGFTIFNDVTARDIQSKDISEREPWFRSKSFDTFAPMGPYLVTMESIKDPQNLKIRLFVNEEVRQNANTKDMLFDIAYLISYISRHLTLYPGDIIATGTPKGIAPLKNGDNIKIEIEKVGTLENSIKII